MKNKLAFGIYEQLPIEDYHDDDALGSSKIKILATKTPAHILGQRPTESAAFDFGSALHLSILEVHKGNTIICGPDDRRGNKWKEAKEKAENDKHILLTKGDYDAVFQARDAVLGHAECENILSGNIKTELSLFHEDKTTGLRCKIRPDIINDDMNIMIDLKTCQSASPHAFAKSIADYGYHIQQAFYQKIWNEHHLLQKTIDAFYFIAVEKTEPYAVAVYELGEASLLEGRNLVEANMWLYKMCKESNNWPGYPVGINTINLPNYAFKTLDPNSLIGGISQDSRL